MRDQADRPIYEELLSIPGIAGAEFEGDARTPDGVRVQLAPGADPDRVGREVRRVLAGHGMRSQMSAPAVAPRHAPPPPEPRTVVNLADFDHGSGPGAGEAMRARSLDPLEPDEAALVEEEPDAALEEPPAEERREAAQAVESGPEAPPAPATTGVPLLEDVVLRQRGGDLFVSVSAGSRVVERPAVASERGIDVALLEAVCDLLGVAPVPALVSVDAAERSGSTVVFVLVDDGSLRHAGSAVSRGNRAWAAARAFWSAVSELA